MAPWGSLTHPMDSLFTIFGKITDIKADLDPTLYTLQFLLISYIPPVSLKYDLISFKSDILWLQFIIKVYL